MDPYTIFMMPGTSITTHISHLQASIVVHIQDPYFEFHHVNTRTRRLLWSLPTVPPLVEFRDRYHDFMVTGAPGWMGLAFRPKIHGVLLLHSL